MQEDRYANLEPFEILVVEHPVLRQKAKPVKKVNKRIREILDRMTKTMYEANGVGLAGNQVGLVERLIVVDVGDGLVQLVNPEILNAEGEEVAFEGCLSIPGFMGEVERATQIRVTGLDRQGRRLWIDAEGFFARALQHEVDHLEGVLYTDKARRVVEIPPETRLRTVFMGTPAFAALVLEDLLENGVRPVAVVTQPDRPAGRGQMLRPSPVKRLAEANELEVLQPDRARDPEFVARLQELEPDVLITAAYGQILPPEVLAVPKLAAVNVHASLLPAYRGAAPIQRALLDSAEKTGITIMHMAPKMDAGDMILQVEVPIEPDDNAGRLHDRLAEAAGPALRQALRGLAKDEADRIPQDESRVTYAPRLVVGDEALVWDRPAVEVVNRIRALSPRPGARTQIGEHEVKVLRGEVAELPAGATSRPGEVVALDPEEGLLVATSDGAVRILEVKPVGKRAMPIKDFLNGYAVEVGSRCQPLTQT